MINKNVADYTNFDGKTNKKIVQAPGGSSSFSFAWSQDKTDYGPERNIKKKDNNYPPYPEPTSKPPSQPYQNPTYNQPIRVMEDPHHHQPVNAYRPETYSAHSSNSMKTPASIQRSGKIGGQYGYNNYTPEQVSPYQGMTKQNYGQQDSLDLKVEEHQKVKVIPKPPTSINSKPPSQQSEKSQSGSSKPSVRVYEQRNNLIIGDNSYNYWKEPSSGQRNSNHSSKRPPLYEQPNPMQEQVLQDKTSVKVHNPPGGKTSFTLG